MDVKILAIIGIIAIATVGAGAFFLLGGDDTDHDISYVLNGGTNDPGNHTEYGNDVIYLKDPKKDYYEFAGWYTEPGFVNQKTELIPGEGKITLYAKWTPLEYSVSYVLNKKETVNINPETVTYEDNLVLKDASNPNFVFEGWYASKEFTEKSKVEKLSKTTSDTTLYAKWGSQAGLSISMYGESQDGTLGIQMDVKVFSYKGDDTVISGFCTYALKPNVGTYYALDYYTSDPDSSSTSEYEFMGTETVDTIDGKKELFVYRSGDMSEWVDGRGIPYKMVLDSTTLTLKKHGTFEESSIVNVTVYKSDGLSVTGGGTYKLGEKVTLRCTDSSFRGYSFDGVTYSVTDNEFSFIATDSLTIFALKDGDRALYKPGDYSNAKWEIRDDMAALIVKNVSSNPAIVNLDYNKSFTATFSGTKDGKTVTEKKDIITGLQFSNVYKWTFNGKQYGMKWNGYLPDYVYYKNLNPNERHHVDVKTDTKFVTYTDDAIIAIRDFLSDQSKNMNELDKANFILRFVQEAIPYKTDTSGKEMDEYWKYPYETLYEMSGDCEDTSILYAALMKSMGYNAALLLFPGHMATGIGMPSGYDGYGWYWYYTNQSNPIKYYYCETTSTGWWLGDKNSKYDTCTIIDV